MYRHRRTSLLLTGILVFIALFRIVSNENVNCADELMAVRYYNVLVDGQEVFTESVREPERIDPESGQEQPEIQSAQDEQESVSEEDKIEYRMKSRTQTVRKTLGAYTNGYDNRISVSLRDLAELLSETSSQFHFELDYEENTYKIITGMSYTVPKTQIVSWEPEYQDGDYYDRDGNLRDKNDEIVYYADDLYMPLERPKYEYLDLYMNPLQKNGSPLRFYTFQLSALEDIYVNIIDVQIMLGITIEKDGEGGLNIYTDRGYAVDLDEFSEDGYFDLFNGVILGDSTTGEVLFGCKQDNVDAIASTSKLMTYMITARYLELGRIGLDDLVTVSENAATLAQSGYGVFYMEEGWQIPVRELLGAMLLNSSNEAAFILAEYIAGTEKEFAVMMNEMARLLDLDSAKFFNASGLPEYSDSLMASVRQNSMSVNDLFRLTCAVLQKYPQILDYTSQKEMYLPTLDVTAYNTNYLLYNMDNAVGLKTGTTDEAGCCLVGSVKAGNAGNEHVLTAIVIGANSNLDRYQIPEVLLTWGTGRLEAQQLSAASQTDEVSAAEDVNVNNQPGTDQDE